MGCLAFLGLVLGLGCHADLESLSTPGCEKVDVVNVGPAVAIQLDDLCAGVVGVRRLFTRASRSASSIFLERAVGKKLTVLHRVTSSGRPPRRPVRVGERTADEGAAVDRRLELQALLPR